MGIILTYNDVKKQSEAVFKQFGESKWIPYAQENAKLEARNPLELRASGLGKFAVLAAMGESLVDAIPLLKKYRERFDLITCDKGFGVLMSHGLKPDYVQICDCNIPFEWLKPYVEQTEGVKLLATCYANPEWTRAWRGPRYFYVNRDSIDTQKVFLPIMGKGIRQIPAGSNVSNAMLIYMMGVDEATQINWAGYEEYFLVGYDYSWRPRAAGCAADVKQGDYYAFNDPRPKRHYMSHRTILDCNNDIVHTSENLLFSAKWLYSYITAYNLPVTNCSGRGILDIPSRMGIEKALSRIHTTPSMPGIVRNAFNTLTKGYEAVDAARRSFDESRRILWQ